MGGTHLFLDLFSSPSPLSKKRKRKLQVRRPDWRQRAAPGREHPALAHHRRSGGRHRAADGRARGAGGHCDRARRHALRAAGSEFGVSFFPGRVRAEAAEPPEPRKVGGRRRGHRRGRASSRREIFLEKVKKTHFDFEKRKNSASFKHQVSYAPVKNDLTEAPAEFTFPGDAR